MKTHEARRWLIVADMKGARLMRYRATPTGPGRLVEMEHVENDWPGHEHHRPSPLGGKAEHAYVTGHHEEEEERRRFTERVSEWVREAAARHAIDAAVVFVPSRVLGDWRKAWPAHAAVRIDLHQGELAGMEENELCDHPAVREAMGIRGAANG